MDSLLINLVILAASFYALAKIVDLYFIESLEIISKKLKLSSDIAGATFMALGSSAPELFISAFALFRPDAGQQAVGAGTIVGSAIFNILVIVGASALFRRAFLTWQPVIRDLTFYIVTILILLFTFLDGTISVFDAALFVGLYGVYLFAFSAWKKMFPYKIHQDGEESELLIEIHERYDKINKSSLSFSNLIDKILIKLFFNLKKRPHLVMANFLIAVLMLAAASHFMVESAVEVAHFFGVPEVIIGLTILAAGTSIPDLLASVAVAKKGQGDMAVANAVGSNIFDINIGLGLPWLIYIIYKGSEISVVTENLSSSIILLFATVVALLFLLISRRWQLGRYAGVLLIAGYVYYVLAQIGIVDTTVCLNIFGSHCVSI